MRRVPAFGWVLGVLAPLVLGLLYALLYPLFAPRPTLADVVPGEAVLVQRYRDLAAFDRGWFRRAGDPVRPSEREAASRNLAGFPGVDPARPVHFVLLPRGLRADPSMLILPVADPDALRARFEDPTFFLEKGFVRHAQHLAVAGDWAAVGGDRDAVRRLGEGGLTAESLGEDDVLAVRVPEAIEFALATPLETPWRPILEALGFDANAAERVADPAGGSSLVVPAGRVTLVHDAWRTARLWSWRDEHRIRADLEPAPGRLRDALRLLASAPPAEIPADAPPSAPTGAQAWLRLPGGAERAAFARALHDAGVPFPAALREGDDPLGALGRRDGSGLLVFAWGSPGFPRAWTLGLVAPALPSLSAFLPTLPPEGGETDVPAGTLALTRADLGDPEAVPAGRVLHRRTRGFEVLLVGPAPDEAWARLEGHLAQEGRSPAPEPPAPGLRLVATFGLSEPRVRTILGGVAAPGGLLAALAGGDVTGEVWSDGEVLRVEARVAIPPGGVSPGR